MTLQLLINQSLNHGQHLYKAHFTKQIALNEFGMTGDGTDLNKAHYIHIWSPQTINLISNKFEAPWVVVFKMNTVYIALF